MDLREKNRSSYMTTFLTKYHGEVELDTTQRIYFPDGIPGLEDWKDYVLLPYEDSVFFILQSIEEAEIAFLVVNIFDIQKDYEYTIPKHVIARLELQNAEDVLSLGIITPKEEFANSTINLYAPLIINLEKNLGKQIFLEQSNYAVKTPLFSGVNN